MEDLVSPLGLVWRGFAVIPRGEIQGGGNYSSKSTDDHLNMCIYGSGKLRASPAHPYFPANSFTRSASISGTLSGNSGVNTSTPCMVSFSG